MEETKAKKEITVKRLSAFKFSVEVSSVETETCNPVRESVIRRAPPSAPAALPSEGTLIRQGILYRIVEVLLWRLIGEQRLTEFCGYPHAPVCLLLRRVLILSEQCANAKTDETTAECDGTTNCFMEQVTKLLAICAPTNNLWCKFGWKNLSQEAIFRKIYIEELSPNMRSLKLEEGTKVVKLLNEIDALLAWERNGGSTDPYSIREEPSSAIRKRSAASTDQVFEKRRFSDERFQGFADRPRWPKMNSVEPSGLFYDGPSSPMAHIRAIHVTSPFHFVHHRRIRFPKDDKYENRRVQRVHPSFYKRNDYPYSSY